MNSFNELFSSFAIGRLTLANRIAFAPVATNLGDDAGDVTDGLVDYYAARARGGVGLIVVESCTMAPEGKATPRQLSIAKDESVAGYRRLTDAVHRYDTKIILQIQHAGRSSVSGDMPVAPSPIPCPFVGRDPRVLTIEDLMNLEVQFGDAAKRARAAGFDGVEVHLAHGYLLNEFLSPLANQRTDEYGGSFDNRLRFPLQVIDRIRKEVGDDFTVTCRISGSEYIDGGLRIEDMKSVAKAVVSHGIEAVSVSGGTYGSVEWIIQPPSIPRGCFVEMAEEIKNAVSVPVMVAGRLNPEKALEAIVEKKADLVAFGRGLVADPDLPNKLKEGQREAVVPCISCNQGCIGRVFAGEHITCMLNPLTGRESHIALKKASKSKKVVVIGGGPAGLKAAAVSAQRGHNVTLYEKDDDLGGQFRLASVPPHKEVFQEGLTYLVREAEQSGAEIVRGHKVDANEVASLEADVLVLAIGAEAIMPDIPGIEKEHVFLAEQVLNGSVSPGRHVAIIGGGLVGCEVASYVLNNCDAEITLFEMLPDIAQDMMVINRVALLKHFAAQLTLHIIRSATVIRIEDNDIAFSKGGKEISLGGIDTVVVAVGYQSQNGLRTAVEMRGETIEIIGDCKSPRKALEAIEEGFFAAIRI